MAKKHDFIRSEACIALANVEIVQTRIEHYEPEARFDIVVSRAFPNYKRC